MGFPTARPYTLDILWHYTPKPNPSMSSTLLPKQVLNSTMKDLHSFSGFWKQSTLTQHNQLVLTSQIILGVRDIIDPEPKPPEALHLRSHKNKSSASKGAAFGTRHLRG